MEVRLKVFISHQRADGTKAEEIRVHLKARHQIESYLDVVDPTIGQKHGPDLAEHVRRQMAECDSLLAVVSPATASSNWVPWEIGIATEKDLPLATFSNSTYSLPEFLQKWPYLTSMAALDKYALELKSYTKARTVAKSYATESYSNVVGKSVRDFYRNLRRDLGQ